MSISEKNKLIDVRDLAVYFHIEQGIVKSVDGVSFSIDRGKSLGLVGKVVVERPLPHCHYFFYIHNLRGKSKEEIFFLSRRRKTH